MQMRIHWLASGPVFEVGSEWISSMIRCVVVEAFASIVQQTGLRGLRHVETRRKERHQTTLGIAPISQQEGRFSAIGSGFP